MTLGERVRTARERAGLSSNELARMVGTSQPSVTRIESGETPKPNVFVVAAIAKALGVTVDELIGDQPLKPKPVTTRSKQVDRLSAVEQKLADLEARLPGSSQKPPTRRKKT